MALNIKDPETDRLARRLARLTGTSITRAVRSALAERLEREQQRRGVASVEELLAVGRRCAERPDQNTGAPNDWLYDEHGFPS